MKSSPVMISCFCTLNYGMETIHCINSLLTNDFLVPWAKIISNWFFMFNHLAYMHLNQIHVHFFILIFGKLCINNSLGWLMNLTRRIYGQNIRYNIPLPWLSLGVAVDTHVIMLIMHPIGLIIVILRRLHSVWGPLELTTPFRDSTSNVLLR